MQNELQVIQIFKDNKCKHIRKMYNHFYNFEMERDFLNTLQKYKGYNGYTFLFFNYINI